MLVVVPLEMAFLAMAGGTVGFAFLLAGRFLLIGDSLVPCRDERVLAVFRELLADLLVADVRMERLERWKPRLKVVMPADGIDCYMRTAVVDVVEIDEHGVVLEPLLLFDALAVARKLQVLEIRGKNLVPSKSHANLLLQLAARAALFFV